MGRIFDSLYEHRNLASYAEHSGPSAAVGNQDDFEDALGYETASVAPEAISDQPFFTIQGTRGELVLGGFAGGATLHTRAGAREVCREGWDASYAGEYAAFVDAARGDAGDLGDWTPESALHDLAVIQAMFDSCDDRRWADVDYGPRDDSES